MTGRALLTLAGHASGVLGVVFSPDGNQLYTVSRDGTAKIWMYTTAEAAPTSPTFSRLALSRPTRFNTLTSPGQHQSQAAGKARLASLVATPPQTFRQKGRNLLAS